MRGILPALVLALATLGGASPPESARIVVKKSERRLFVYDAHDHVTKSYRIALGRTPLGKKREEGDGATPEGDYIVTHRNPKSRFHLSLGVSYPNASDAQDGISRGLITRAEEESIAEAAAQRARPPQHTRLGGDIFLHGGGTTSDWTEGCIALTDDDIDDLAARVPLRTPLRIVP